MKTLLFSLSLFFSSFTLHAKCGSNGIWVTGTSRVVFDNSLLVLEFYGSSQSIAIELNKKHPIYLQSGTEKIHLLVMETLPGEFGVTQVVLRPNAGLIAGKEYTLVISNLKETDAKPEEFDADYKKRKPYIFTCVKTTDTQKPLFIATPVETKKTLVHFGCGPAKWVYYQQLYKDESVVFVRTYVKDKTTGRTTVYLLSSENGEVKVGHGMCSGSFEFTAGHAYEISFVLVDLAGNSGDKTAAIPLTPPISVTTEE